MDSFETAEKVRLQKEKAIQNFATTNETYRLVIRAQVDVDPQPRNDGVWTSISQR